MARDKYDGVVEAVHYVPGGKIAWVRAYERRGSAFSERLILDRETLVSQLRQGKRYVVGKRVPYLGSTFEVSDALNLVTKNSSEYLVIGERQAEEDDLKGVPII